MRKGKQMRRSSKIFGILTLAVVTLGLAACGNETIKAAATATPTPTTARFTEPEWTIATPAGWTRKDITKDADADKAIRYQGPNGEYFIVAIDPLGSGFSYDALWRYEVRDDRFEVVSKYDCAGKDDESCTPDDGRFDAYILWKNGTTPEMVGGHSWYFIFGNTKATTVDNAEFEQMFESLRVTA
jgi:hypothetical protein